MTLQEIFVRALEQADEDASALDERRAFLKQVVNEAYADLVTAAQPYAEADAVPGEDGRVEFASLPGRCVRVLGVTSAGRGVPFVAEGTNAIRVAQGVGEVRVSYRCLMDDLVLPTDVPELPERFHGALADYASYCLLGQGGRSRQARGDYFLARFLRARAQVSFDTGDTRRGRIHNKF